MFYRQGNQGVGRIIKSKKKSRRSDSCSCGDFKYYLAPEGMIKVEELPETWGLIVADQDGNIKILRQAVYSQGSKFNDIAMMYSILRAYEAKKTIFIRNKKITKRIMDKEYKEAKYNTGDTVWYVDYHHFTDIENTNIFKAKITTVVNFNTSGTDRWYAFEDGGRVPEDNVFADPYEMVEEVKKHVEFNLEHYRKALVDRIEYFNQIIKQEELCS